MTPLTVSLSPQRRPVAALVMLLAVPVVYTAVVVVAAPLRLQWVSADGRVVVTTLGLSIALSAALALRLPPATGGDVSRRAWVAALAALALMHALVLVGFVLLIVPGEADDAAAFYAWLAARYTAALLFVAAALGWPRWSARGYLFAVAAPVTVAGVLCAAAAGVLPQPFARTTEGLAVVTATVPARVFVTAVPGLLFLVAAVLSWRSFRRDQDRLWFWMTVALLLQVLSKVHELGYQSAFGPVLTTADALLVAMIVVLLAVALSSVRQLVRDRTEALEAQREDMRMLSETFSSLLRFTEQEQLFRSIVVHELATPIAAMRAYAHVLQHPASSAGQQEAAAQAIADEGERLQQLIDRMDQLRELESGPLELDLRPVRLASLLDEVAAFGRALPGAHQVVVHCGAVTVLADPVRLGQAVRNLVANAVRYSPAGSPVLVRCGAEGGTVTIEVIDRGPGVPEDERDRVVEKYARGRGQQEAPGFGIGLFLTRQIVEAHGGVLRLLSAETGGTRAVIELREAK